VAQRTAELKHRARQLQRLTLDLSQAEDRERKRLAEILHDDLQQVLAAAKFQLSLLKGRVKNDPQSQEIAGQVKDLLADAINKSRRLSHELSSPALAQSDLSEAFEWLTQQIQTKHGLTVHLDVRGRIELPSEPLRALLYRAAQELLFNVIKHAGVREARLRVRHRRGRICLFVSDKGQGFDPKNSGKTSGFGLLSIRERIDLLGGRMKIRSIKGKGSTFLITVPDSEAGESALPKETPSAQGRASASAAGE
jgi:two-component system CheB/CheR fusion protein